MSTAPPSARTIDVDGRWVTLTNVDKILWPTLGLRKAWLIAYYDEIADVILPHLGSHPVTLHRFPDGTGGSHWYQTRAPAHPEWVRTVEMRPPRTGKVFDVVVIDDRASLLWAANLGTIELHPYLGCAERMDAPRHVVFDLDPGDGVDIATTAGVARRLRDVLDGLGLDAWVKTSGGIGLHVYVPLNTPHTYADTKTFAHGVAGLLQSDDPDGITTVMARRARPGKVFVDWSQNDAGKSTVAPYSLRGYTIPTVSTPATWSEIARIAQGQSEVPTTPVDVFERLERLGDLFAPVLTVEQRLPSSV